MDQKKTGSSAGTSAAANDIPKNNTPEPKPPAEPEKKVESPPAPTDSGAAALSMLRLLLSRNLRNYPIKNPAVNISRSSVLVL